MGAKTKQVGGGQNTETANMWNSFLQSQLSGGNGMQQGGPAMTNNNPADPRNFGGGLISQGLVDALKGRINQEQNNAAQPQMQQGGFQQAFQGMLGGQVNDQSGAGAALQNFFQNPGGMNAPTNFSNQYTSPQYQAPTLQGLPTNFGQGQTGMANLGGFGNAQQSGFNTQQNLGNISSQFTNPLAQAMSSMQGQSGFAGASAGPAVQMNNPMDFRQAYDTLGQDPLAQLERQRAVADQRARFGAEGAGSLGTGAQYAEGTLNSDFLARDASNRRNQAMALMGQDLASQQALANVGLQNRGVDAQTAVANMQGGLQGAQNMNSANANMLQTMLGARGQDLSTLLGQRGQNLDQLGMGLQQDQFNAGQGNSMQQAMMQAVLQNQGMGNNFGLAAAGLNNEAGQMNNQNNLASAQMGNNFNLSNAGNTAQYGLGAQQLNSQNQLANNQMFQNMIGQGLNLNQLGNQNIQQMLARLFGSFGQSNQIGSPQAQMVTQPSTWGQIAQAGLGLGGAFLGGPGGAALGSALGGMFNRR